MRDLAELIVIRHAESVANAAFAADRAGRPAPDLAGPDGCVDLTERGRAQATAVGAWLATLPARRRPEVIFVSPYRRATETWRIAATASALTWPPAHIDARLADRDMGAFTLLTETAIAARYPAEAARRKREGDVAYRPPSGESFHDVTTRTADLLFTLRHDYPSRRVLIIAHDITIQTFRHLLEHRPLETLITDPSPPNTATIIYRSEAAET